KIDITNIKCIAKDHKFGGFDYCYMKSVNRTYKYFSVKYDLYQHAGLNTKVNVVLFKHNNGWKPFIYNVTVDACKFMENPGTYPIAKYFYEIVVSSSNLNHSCPYTHDIIFDKLTGTMVNHHFTNILPFPEGHYMIYVRWAVYEVERAVTIFYGTLS
ncbi:hypothetical protein KR074_012090, partial [Drosophila pseudoananassae]